MLRIPKKIIVLFLVIFLIVINLSPAYSQDSGDSGGGGLNPEIPNITLFPENDDYYYILSKDQGSFYVELDVKSNDTIIGENILLWEVIPEIVGSPSSGINVNIVGDKISFGMGSGTIQGQECGVNTKYYIRYKLVINSAIQQASITDALVTVNVRRGGEAGDSCTDEPPPPECQDSGGCEPPPPPPEEPVNVVVNSDQYSINIDANTPATGNTLTMNVLSNDTYPANFAGCTLDINSQPTSGAVTKSGNNLIFTYDKDIVAVGVPEQFSFTYSVVCGDQVDSNLVTINISASNDEEPPPECEGENCEPPPPPPQGDCDLCILFGYFNASLGEIKLTLENKLADITLKIGQIALNLTFINNKITENIENPPPPDSGDNPPPPDSGDNPPPDSGDNSNNSLCNPLPADYKGGPLAPIADSSGVIKPWCEYRQIVVCPDLFNHDNFMSVIFGENGLGDKFPLDLIGNYPSSAGGGDLIITFQGKDFDLSWWLGYINIIKFPAWIAFLVWVLVRL